MTGFLFDLTLCWACFACLYFFLFRKEKFFSANRFYLLGALSMGWLLPLLLAINPGVAATTTGTNWLPVVVIGLQKAATSINGLQPWSGWIGLVWCVGSAWMLLRCGWGLNQIRSMVRNAHTRKKAGNYTLVIHPAATLPFSFFNWVFVANISENDKELDTMIAHEKAHASGKHSLDILYCEALCIIFWWNPLVHWYKKTLRTVHEYIADEKTAQQFSRKQYGLLLIRHAQSGPAFALANHFFQSPLKQRLVMLTKNASAPIHQLKYALVIPVFTLLLCFFQQPTLIAQSSESTKQQAEKQPEYPGGMAALGQFLSANLKYPAAARKDNVEGMVVVSFIVNKEGRVEQTEIKKSVRADLDEEAIRVVKQTVWVPGVHKGERVNCQLQLPIKFKLD